MPDAFSQAESIDRHAFLRAEEGRLRGQTSAREEIRRPEANEWIMVKTVVVVPEKVFLGLELTTLGVDEDEAWLPSFWGCDGWDKPECFFDHSKSIRKLV